MQTDKGHKSIIFVHEFRAIINNDYVQLIKLSVKIRLDISSV